MRSWVTTRCRQLWRRPWLTLSWVLAAFTVMYVVAAPFAAARYPPMTDLPFHAANAAVFAHYADQSYHFREQFVLQPWSVPYLSHYLLAALLMQFTNALTAIKLATAMLLLLLPAGLAVLAHGMRKSPLLGLAGLLLVWCQLTSWGFINFVAALGLFAMALGAALRTLDRAGRGWQVFLTAVLVVLFFTHPFRFPFAVLAIVAATITLYPLTHRWQPLLWPVIGPSALFALWWLTKPATLQVAWGPLTPNWARLSELPAHLYPTQHDPALQRALTLALTVVACLALCLWLLRPTAAPPPASTGTAFTRRAQLLVGLCALGFLVGYLVLPMEVSSWWYIYPREATACAFISLALLPDLPRRGWGATLCVLAFALAAVPIARVMKLNGRDFNQYTKGFSAAIAHIPKAPKLLYLIFDHSGARTQNTPFIHLPAYVQADRGGWLSFHFASMGGSPLRYRSDSAAVVPPAVPRRWEWTPQRFNMARDGAFFDWFLVRRQHDPKNLLRGGGQLELVAHQQHWWLYHRTNTPRAQSHPQRPPPKPRQRR